jgi:hypothetical protein
MVGTFTCNLPGTDTDGLWFFYTKAGDIAGNIESVTGSDTSIIVDTTKPAIPTLISVENPAQDGRLNLSWTPGTDTNLAGYKIHYGTQSGTYTQVVSVFVSTSSTLDSLTNGTCYYIVISAYDKAGNESDRSNELSGVPTGSLTKIRIEDQVGIEIGTVNITTDGTLTLYLRGYDNQNNLIGYVAGTWTILEGIGTCNPTYSTMTIFDPTRVGVGTITATDSVHTDTTEAITVAAGYAHYFKVEASPDNIIIPTKATFTLTIIPYDKDNNPTTYNGTALITDLTNTISTNTTGIINAEWRGSLTITKSLNTGIDTITVTSGTRTGKGTILIYIDKNTPVIVENEHGTIATIETGTLTECFVITIKDARDSATFTTVEKPAKPIGVCIDVTITGTSGTEFHEGFVIFVEVPYKKANLGGIDESTLRLYTYNAGSNTWNIVPSSWPDTDKNIIYGTLTHLTWVVPLGLVTFAPDNNHVKVYPNPCKKSNTINFANMSNGAIIKIYNIAGELVKEIPVTKSPQEWNISEGKIASGVYVYVVTGGGGGKSVGKIGIVK